MMRLVGCPPYRRGGTSQVLFGGMGRPSESSVLNTRNRSFSITDLLGLQLDRFTGKVNWVKLDLGSDAHDHLVDPERALAVAMSVQ